MPVKFLQVFRTYFGGEENVLDARDVLFRVKYEKSENEMRMIREASKICDVMIEGMLAVLRPGLYETQVAQWGRAIAGELDVAARGFSRNWNDVIIPGFDYILVEKTLGKFGREVEVLNDLPVNVQHLVGPGFSR